MYHLYLDRQEDFSCDINVKNASLKDAFARVIVEGNGFSLMFKGDIQNGKCIVPIKKLKGLLEENKKGKMFLEVVVDDTYFTPWSDEFIVDEHTSVKVAVKEQKKPSNKPLLEVKVKKSENNSNSSVPAGHIVFICEKLGINKENIKSRKSDFKQIIKEYFKDTPEFAKNSKEYIQEAISILNNLR